MVDLLSTELLKLKRSKMLVLSLAGAALAPFFVVLAFYIDLLKMSKTDNAIFEALFYNTSMYTILLMAVPLYSVVIAYLFGREYIEDTLKNLLTIPVTRTSIILSKMLLLLLWIYLLTLEAWVVTFVFGLLLQFKGLTMDLMLDSLIEYMIGATLLAVLSTPIVLIVTIMKSYVPAIIASIAITLVNLLVFNSDYRALNPWSAVFDIAHDSLSSVYPAAVTYSIIALTSITGLVITLIYFRKVDIH
ncbi:bacitracin transport system permease protein [Paenibacillus catalpae]|uniref:Bacitracin transport system permease protein n=1 Tax=Paenibacillus catalpae TaxID=1045775 RepID=A0A1I2ALS5_9BACL|nr:ABC transporter permease [Paenibacillus catalpae]SFE44862.1 bacitracin transport system permease protein [Paenibacillus catalpae]